MNRRQRLVASGWLLLVLLAAFGPAARADESVPPLLLISLDAFRWDYCALHPAETPHLRQLAREGISARELIPVYPSNTFPNHYAIVTGLYPAHSGMINNDMFDPALGVFFHYNIGASVHDPRWWGGEPIWVTAIKQGRKSATSIWVGSEAAIEGIRPTYWKLYASISDFGRRLAELESWLTLPPAERPAVVTFYLEEANSIGHKYGPDSPELAATLKLLDDRVGAILDGLKAAQVTANLIVVSDHGMTGISSSRVLVLDDYVDPASVQVDFHNPEAGLRPLRGSARDLARALARMPHARVYLTKNQPARFGSAEFWHRLFHPSAYLPDRFHLTDNARIPPVWIVPDEGWEVQPRAYFNTYRATMNHGDHGFDNTLRSMHGILIARGPSFKAGGAVIDPVANIHIYNLMCAALHLTPAPNDGDDRLVRAMLRPTP